MYIGSTNYSKIYVGSSAVNKVYKGTTQVYSAFQYEAESLALFTRMTGSPSTEVKNLINKLIVDYKACGYWDVCDIILKFNIFDAQAGLLDMKGYINATAVNSPTFTKYYGYQGDAATNYINMNYVPSVNGVKAKLNDVHFYRDFEEVIVAGTTRFDGGGNGSYGLVTTANNNGSYLNLQRVNASAGASIGTIGVGSNFAGRINATEAEGWRNGTKTTVAQVTTTFTNGRIYLFAATWNAGNNPLYHNSNKLRGASIGGYCDDTMKAAVKTANDYFNNNIGGTF